MACTHVWCCVSIGVESAKKQLAIITEETGGEWNAERDIRSFPSNAFGKVEFLKEGLGGKKPSKVSVAFSVISGTVNGQVQ